MLSNWFGNYGIRSFDGICVFCSFSDCIDFFFFFYTYIDILVGLLKPLHCCTCPIIFLRDPHFWKTLPIYYKFVFVFFFTHKSSSNVPWSLFEYWSFCFRIPDDYYGKQSCSWNKTLFFLEWDREDEENAVTDVWNLILYSCIALPALPDYLENIGTYVNLVAGNGVVKLIR